MTQLLRVLQDLALLVARVGLGAILVMHGWRRWQEQGLQQQVDYLGQFGTPYPTVAAWGAVLLELIGGAFLIVGALTPLVALALLVEQVLIVILNALGAVRLPVPKGVDPMRARPDRKGMRGR